MQGRGLDPNIRSGRFRTLPGHFFSALGESSMTNPSNEDLVELISREVLRLLGGALGPSPQPLGRRGEEDLVMETRSGPEPFILAPESFPYSATTPRTELSIEKGFVRIGVSARHCHLTPEHVEILFGPGARLTVYRDLLQPGEFAAEQTLTVVGPRMRALEKVRILGPARKKTQVEVSLTDAIYLGLRPPVRPSGNHEGSVGAVLVGPKGSVNLESGVIRANRHIHLHTRDAQLLGLQDNMRVMVRIGGDRPVLYHDVQLRVSDKFVSEMHLDTDDANAAGVTSGDYAQIVSGIHECRVVDSAG